VVKGRDIDRAADALAWREAHLPELTPEHVEALKRAGFDAAKLRHLAARGRYGRSLAVSVLICFTDAYPQAASVQDVARAGEASRMITSRSAAEFEAVLAARGLHSSGPATHDRLSLPKSPGRGGTGGRGTTRTLWWPGWLLVVLLALATTSGLAALDFGVGAVFGVIWLMVGWALVVKRTLYGRSPVPKRIRRTYLIAALGFVIASAGAADAVMVCFGQQGVGRIERQTLETGSHGTTYWQCSVRQPDGSYDELRFGGACPGPAGTPVTMVYLAGGEDQPWRPVLGTDASLAPMVALWGAGTLTGCALLTRAALSR
jgi:hypothetical protein